MGSHVAHLHELKTIAVRDEDYDAYVTVVCSCVWCTPGSYLRWLGAHSTDSLPALIRKHPPTSTLSLPPPYPLRIPHPHPHLHPDLFPSPLPAPAAQSYSFAGRDQQGTE